MPKPCDLAKQSLIRHPDKTSRYVNVNVLEDLVGPSLLDYHAVILPLRSGIFFVEIFPLDNAAVTNYGNGN